MNILEDLYPNIRPKKSPVVRVVLLHRTITPHAGFSTLAEQPPAGKKV